MTKHEAVFVARFPAILLTCISGLYVATDLIPGNVRVLVCTRSKLNRRRNRRRKGRLHVCSQCSSVISCCSLSVCLPVPIYSNRSDFSRQLASSRAKLILWIACTQRRTILPAWAGPGFWRFSRRFVAFPIWFRVLGVSRGDEQSHPPEIDGREVEFSVAALANAGIIVVPVIPRRKLYNKYISTVFFSSLETLTE